MSDLYRILLYREYIIHCKIYMYFACDRSVVCEYGWVSLSLLQVSFAKETYMYIACDRSVVCEYGQCMYMGWLLLVGSLK